MKPTVTQGIILSRVSYQEADRILTILSSDEGKLRVIAKGVRKERSKLAGGVELFSINELSFLRGRGEVGTLVSSRLVKYFEDIVKDVDRTMYGYDFLKLINKVTEDNSGREYFDLTWQVLQALNHPEISLPIVKLWADSRLLAAAGYSPNLQTDTNDNKLVAENRYDFEIAEMAFVSRLDGLYSSSHIKLLRLALTQEPRKLSFLEGLDRYETACQQLMSTIRKSVMHS